MGRLEGYLKNRKQPELKLAANPKSPLSRPNAFTSMGRRFGALHSIF